ncbi:hypothetical protein [Micromonospora sp. NPDC003776]
MAAEAVAVVMTVMAAAVMAVAVVAVMAVAVAVVQRGDPFAPSSW